MHISCWDFVPNSHTKYLFICHELAEKFQISLKKLYPVLFFLSWRAYGQGHDELLKGIVYKEIHHRHTVFGKNDRFFKITVKKFYSKSLIHLPVMNSYSSHRCESLELHSQSVWASVEAVLIMPSVFIKRINRSTRPGLIITKLIKKSTENYNLRIFPWRTALITLCLQYILYLSAFSLKSIENRNLLYTSPIIYIFVWNQQF